MTEGFVYVLTSINCPFIKIGGPENPPTVRIREINVTPAYRAHGPWMLSDFRQVLDWRQIEAQLHQEFRDKRVDEIEGTRELFAMAVADGRRALARLPRALLKRADEVDQMFQERDLALYLENLFRFSGLPAWLHTQGAWTLRLFPNTSGGRYFTLNIGGHEVAFSPRDGNEDGQRHYLVVDKLVADFPETIDWLSAHGGRIEDADYVSSYGRAVRLFFCTPFAKAEQIFSLPGVRRALLAYWFEALVDLHERNKSSAYARYHDYNATAEIISRIGSRPIF